MPKVSNCVELQALAHEVACYLGLDLGGIKIKRFADGEIYVQVQVRADINAIACTLLTMCTCMFWLHLQCPLQSACRHTALKPGWPLLLLLCVCASLNLATCGCLVVYHLPNHEKLHYLT